MLMWIIPQNIKAVYQLKQGDYISLTDMAKYKNAEIPATVISHWLSTNFSINYMGLWERMNNPDFNLTGFSEVKMLSAEPAFALSPKQWIERTNAIGIVSKAGRYGGGTFAHRNIAFEFASWLSPEFKYYLISEFEAPALYPPRQNSRDLRQAVFSLADHAAPPFPAPASDPSEVPPAGHGSGRFDPASFCRPWLCK
ncbi:MAG: KilA-N domain-containing protein, partial [Candidatus Adiutrix sp.]|nr:KilA-N domain-containing protein [Candidatus Adiutrix sp.]